VLEIYMGKLALQRQSWDDGPDTDKMQLIKGQSVCISAMYTSRTIRHIWNRVNRQSWAYATRHLWNLEPHFGDENMTGHAGVEVLLSLSSTS
jgi:hypothetical protein